MDPNVEGYSQHLVVAPLHPLGRLAASSSFLNMEQPPQPNRLCRLRGFNAPSGYLLDMMHTGAGIIKSLLKLIQDIGAFSPRVAHYEATRNGRDFSGLLCAGKWECDVRRGLIWIALIKEWGSVELQILKTRSPCKICLTRLLMFFQPTNGGTGGGG